MSYTKRTCVRCGYRDIQPNMKQITESYTSGYSQKAISNRSIVGAFLGDPRAQRQNADWLLGNTKRKYTRNRRVWVCKSNCGSKPTESTTNTISRQNIAPKRLPRNALPKMAELKDGDCRATHFYETVGELEWDERTDAENALVMAYLEWSLDNLATWYEKALSFIWISIRYIFIAASILLWLLFIASLTGFL